MSWIDADHPDATLASKLAVQVRAEVGVHLRTRGPVARLQRGHHRRRLHGWRVDGPKLPTIRAEAKPDAAEEWLVYLRTGGADLRLESPERVKLRAVERVREHDILRGLDVDALSDAVEAASHTGDEQRHRELAGP